VRLAIIFDGEKWYVRRIRVIEHDLFCDEKVYRCDKPIGNDLATPEEAVAIAAVAIASDAARRKVKNGRQRF
jgi:hypothetical protein